MPIKKINERGDTLVEVLLAFTLLALVSVGVFSLMHRGVGETQNALERSQVRMSINQQTELANYLRDQYAVAVANGSSTTVYPASLWGAVKTRAAANKSTSPSASDNCSSVMANSFSIIYDTATSAYAIQSFTAANLTTATFARPGAGLWIEPVASNGAAVPYVDLYVKACWSPASGAVKQSMSTVVRLYDK